MKSVVNQVRKTCHSAPLGVIRIMAGVILASTGIMKLFVPSLGEAWSGQLIQSGLPFYTLTFYVVPYLEIIAGALLALGYFARLWALVLAGIMIPATYVHLVVDDPSVFPMQPHSPIVPLMMLGFAAYIIAQGAGPWSLDTKGVPKH